MELYSVLVKARFAASKREPNISYKKFHVRLTSRVHKQLKTWYFRKLSNFGNVLNLRREITYCSVFLPEIKLQQRQSKSTQRQMFVENCLNIQTLTHNLSQSLKDLILWYLYNFKVFLQSLKNLKQSSCEKVSKVTVLSKIYFVRLA